MPSFSSPSSSSPLPDVVSRLRHWEAGNATHLKPSIWRSQAFELVPTGENLAHHFHTPAPSTTWRRLLGRPQTGIEPPPRPWRGDQDGSSRRALRRRSADACVSPARSVQARRSMAALLQPQSARCRTATVVMRRASCASTDHEPFVAVCLASVRKPGMNSHCSDGVTAPDPRETLPMTRTHLIALCVSATLVLRGTSYAATLYQYNFDNGTSGSWTPSDPSWTICRTVTTGTPEYCQTDATAAAATTSFDGDPAWGRLLGRRPMSNSITISQGRLASSATRKTRLITIGFR